MNIQVTPFRLTPNFTQHSQNNNSFNYNKFSTNNLAPLAQDSVTFTSNRKKKKVEDDAETQSTAKSKVLDDNKRKTNRISYLMATEINKESEAAKNKFLNTLKVGLKNVTENDQNPDRPILRGKLGIYGRVKQSTSIMQKVPPRELRTKDEILKMGDVIGARIILKDSSRKSFDAVFTELGKMVMAGQLNVLEVENYRMRPEESYISQRTLDKFEKACAKAGQTPKISSSAIKSGYTAIHLTVKLPEGQYAEVQIMGRDMERIKELEDFFYKKRCNKPIPPKYKPIEDVFDAVMGKKGEKLDNFQKETLDRYIQDSYAHARTIPPMSARRRSLGKDYFLQIPYTLPSELSFENLQKIKDQCDRVFVDEETVRKMLEEINGGNNTGRSYKK